MRFLGPTADAADEIITKSDYWTKVLTSDFSFGTVLGTNTAVTAFDTTLGIGTWQFRMELDWTTTGTASNVFFLIDKYSGTVSDNLYKVARYTGSAIVGSFGQVFGAEYTTSTTVPQGATVTGFCVVTAAALIGVDIRRAASTTGVLKKGSSIIFSRV